MCVDIGGSHFRERGGGSQGFTKRGFTGGVHEKWGSQGGSQKGGSR